MTSPLSSDELRRIDAWWRAANYLSVGQIYLLDNPLLREPLTLEHVKPRLLGHWGTTPGLNLLYAHLNRAIAARDLDAIFVTGPGHGGPGLVANDLPRGHLHRGLPRHHARRGGHARLFRQFSFPGGIPSHVAPETPGLDPRGRRARLRARARLRRRVRQPGPARLLRRRRRRGRDRPAGRELALEQVPQPGARRRRAADPAPQRLQDRQPDRARAHPARTSCARCCEGYGHAPRFVDGRRPDDGAPGAGGRARRRARRDRARSSARARGRRVHGAAALADDRAAHAEGLDGPEGGRRPAGRGHVALAPGAARRPRATNPEHLRQLEEWLRSYRPEELFDEDGRAARRARRAGARGRAPDGRQPARQRRRCCCATCGCPTSATTPSTCPRRRRPRSEATRVLGALPARRHAPQRGRRELPRLRPRRDRVEPARRRVRGDRPRLDGRDRAGRRPPRARRPRDGGAERAPVPGLARGLPADRPPRALQLLRGVHPHRRLDVQPAREVAEGHARRSRGGGRSRRSTTCSPRTSGARTTTASPTRTRASSTTWSTRRPRSSASTCRRTRTACCRWPTTACAAATTST